MKHIVSSLNLMSSIHLIAFADLFISDSQTMSMEAGYLGIPYIRFNDFVGKISALDELENKYELGFGILTKNKERLFEKIDELISYPNLKNDWLIKRQKMLADTIDLSKFMIWLYENYPESKNILLKILNIKINLYRENYVWYIRYSSKK